MPRRTNDPDTNDNILFLATCLGTLTLLALLAATAIVRAFGDPSAAQDLLEWGLCGVVLVPVAVLIVQAGRR